MFFPFIFPQFIDFNSNLFSSIYNFNYYLRRFRFFIFNWLMHYLAQKLIEWIKANPKTINTISASVLVIIAAIIVVTQQY